MKANELKEILKQHNLWLADWTTGMCANLSHSNLSHVNLSHTNLSHVKLRNASLHYADLSNANLSYSDLRYANLRYVKLRNASLHYADLSNADLRYSDLRYANLSNAKLSKTKFFAVNPYPQLAAKIAEQVVAHEGSLVMDCSHTCNSVNCLAGWAVTLHPQGKDLQTALGTSAAAAFIFQVCCGEVPDFFSDKKTAIAWVKCKANQRGQK